MKRMLPSILLATAVVSLPGAWAEEEGVPPEFQQVIDGIAENYNKILTINGKFEEAHEDRGVDKQEETTVYRNDDGGVIATTVRFANIWYSGKLTVRGDDYRVSRVRTDNEQKWEVTKKGDEWRIDSARHVQTYQKSGLPGYPVVNPKEFPAHGIKIGLLETLKNQNVVSITDIGDDSLKLRRMVVSDPRTETQTTWEFDPDRSYLPVQKVTRWPGTDNVLSVVEIDYQKILDGKAYYPRQMIQRYFDRDRAQNLNSDAWRQRLTWKLVKVRVNERVDLE